MKNSNLNFILLLTAFLGTASVSAINTCSNPSPIPQNDWWYTTTGSTLNVTNDNATSGASLCGTAVGTGGQQWYSYTWNGCGNPVVEINTHHSDFTTFDTKIHVYDGSCGSLNCVTGNDDADGNLSSEVTFTAIAGVTYYIRIGGFGALEGGYFLSVVRSFGGCKDPGWDNYNPNAIWHDCNCCNYGTISLSADAGEFASALIFVDNVLLTTAYAGWTTGFCAPKTCGNYVAFFGCNQGATATIEIDGIVQTVTATSSSSITVPLQTSYCGCMDPTAVNYNSTAYLNSGECYYSANYSCSSAIEIQPNTLWNVNSQNVPTSAVYNEGCEWFSGKQLLWFKFVYQGGTVRIHTPNSNYDTVLGLFSGCDDGTIACIDDSQTSYSNDNGTYFQTNASLQYDCNSGLEKGHTYYIGVGMIVGGGEFPMIFNQYDNPGCTDPFAINYDSCASLEDNSCIYQNNCPADLDGNMVVNVGDLLLFAAQFGSNCGTSENAE